MTIEESLKLYNSCFFLELEGTELLKLYTPQYLSTICNGIGAEWMGGKFRWILGKFFPYFEEAAYIHDLEFSIGGTFEDFKKANERFGRNVKKTASKKIPWYLFVREIIVCLEADKAVELLNIGGMFAYNFKSKDERQ